MVCAIWGVPAEEEPRMGDARTINSPRAGGRYFIDGTAEALLQGFSVAKKKAVTRWLVRQHSLGISVPKLTADSLGLAAQQPPLAFTEKVNATLSLMGKDMLRIDSGFQISMHPPTPDHISRLLAVSDSDDLRDAVALLGLLRNMSLLTDAGSSIGVMRYTLTAAGWERFESLHVKMVITSQAFVAMWFNPTMDNAFIEGFEPAISKAGYAALRIDKKEHINKVDDEIIAEIRRSRFLVSDFTCEPEKPRGGVYFEAGFAMGLGIPVIWTCNKTSMNDLHFDTRQFNHIVWEKPSDLCDQLYARIGAAIGDGPRRT